MTSLRQQADLKPAYKAYVHLDRLPKNAPRFEMNEHGYPIMGPGELRCRMPGLERHICGDKFFGTWTLLDHCQNMHDAPKAHRPTTKHGKLSGAALTAAASM
ncbi:hypothetical protein LTR36_009567 [Oleoguttula mirabilis]|uniref:C2H2-type domain-containing protein n=1 Tax=Oleoguttula mirabilis TaxID=1507867 RepID=A0AAV9JUI7_9PEZI|nr:hypothetical protein LTR36_009567 [Oleoguttula mirabilis]